MSKYMSLSEKYQRFEKQLLSFEEKKKWKLGHYTFSEYLFLIVIGLWAADVLPRFISLDSLFWVAVGATVLYIVYIIAIFAMSGGRGRVVQFV